MMMDPFDWNEPRLDLTATGRRIHSEAQRITEAGQHRYSIFSDELNTFTAANSGRAAAAVAAAAAADGVVDGGGGRGRGGGGGVGGFLSRRSGKPASMSK